MQGDFFVGLFSIHAIVLVFLLFSTVPATGGTDSDLQIPARDINVHGATTPPMWKNHWDSARQLVRDNQYLEAKLQYERVLASKHTVDEARWEYAVLLMHLEAWQQAGIELESLLRRHPESRRFTLARAKTLLKQEETGRAARLYGRVYQDRPYGREAIEPLKGLVAALEADGKYGCALPLQEQLMLRRPDDVDLKRRAAATAASAGDTVRSVQLLTAVHHHRPKDLTVLRELAHAEQAQGNHEAAMASWRLLLEKMPENSEALRQLALDCRLSGDGIQELIYLERLLTLHPEEAELLRRAADLNMELARVDRAFLLYGKYMELHPEDLQVNGLKEAAQTELARSLLALVKTDDPQWLWQDLEHITAERDAVYLSMAKLLRDEGNPQALAQVLEVLQQSQTPNHEIRREIALLLQEKNAMEAETLEN
ncbi:MAG: hypothetical protein CSA34_04170 [Desulfobulbus propionicus]|nr:MAG: hypothetical protein CSA34_04170 [Desulfobulbus propionicus]